MGYARYNLFLISVNTAEISIWCARILVTKGGVLNWRTQENTDNFNKM